MFKYKNRKEYMRNYFQRNKQKLSKCQKEYRQQQRLICLVHYSDNPPKCACCEEQHIEFLTIDHIHGGGNIHRLKILGGKSHAGIPFYLWLIRNNFPEGFQVLCFNCNSLKTKNIQFCSVHHPELYNTT
jgi:hypothetical protein